jgi:dTDP-4-dehydrorhamnose 3,5-epimerase
MDVTPHIIELSRYPDDRGWFEPWFLESERLGFIAKQVNFNKTKKNAFRGFHFAVGEKAQAKYVSCISGHVRDFIIDTRYDSPSFGKVYEFELSGDIPSAVYIPVGFAHGIYGLANESFMVYTATEEWIPNIELTITPFDPSLNLGINLEGVICTEKDRCGMLLNEYKGIKS